MELSAASATRLPTSTCWDREAETSSWHLQQLCFHTNFTSQRCNSWTSGSIDPTHLKLKMLITSREDIFPASSVKMSLWLIHLKTKLLHHILSFCSATSTSSLFKLHQQTSSQSTRQKTSRTVLLRSPTEINSWFLSAARVSVSHLSQPGGCETNTRSSFRPPALLSTSLTSPGSRHFPAGPWGLLGPQASSWQAPHVSESSTQQFTIRTIGSVQERKSRWSENKPASCSRAALKN